MTFDTRARRAVQGIHDAVEAMEMSGPATPQTLRFELYRERKTRNQRIAAIAVGIAVPVALLIGAVRLLASEGDSNVPLTTPSTSVTLTPQPVSGRSETFEAPFTFKVPSDWTFSGEAARYYSWDLNDGSMTHLIALSSVVAATPDSCVVQPAQGVGTSSDAMTNWLSTHPALDATTPRPVTLGAATGSYVDIQIADDWNQTCAQGLALLTGKPSTRSSWSIYGPGKLRIYVLDVPGGDTVSIVVDVPQKSDFPNVIDGAAAFVESFEFLK